MDYSDDLWGMPSEEPSLHVLHSFYEQDSLQQLATNREILFMQTNYLPPYPPHLSAPAQDPQNQPEPLDRDSSPLTSPLNSENTKNGAEEEVQAQPLPQLPEAPQPGPPQPHHLPLRLRPRLRAPPGRPRALGHLPAEPELDQEDPALHLQRVQRVPHQEGRPAGVRLRGRLLAVLGADAVAGEDLPDQPGGGADGRRERGLLPGHEAHQEPPQVQEVPAAVPAGTRGGLPQEALHQHQPQGAVPPGTHARQPVIVSLLLPPITTLPIIGKQPHASELLLAQPLLHELDAAVVVVGEVVVLVALEGALHHVQQLALARVVGLADLGLDLVEPHFDGVELRAVGGQVHHLHVPLLGELHGLLLVVDGAVVHDQPLLPALLRPHLVQLLEQLPDELQVLVLAVGALDDAPVRQPVLPDDRDQREALPLGNGAVDGDLLVGPRPGLLPGHVEVEAGLVEEVDLGLAVEQLLVLGAELVPALELLGGVALLGHAPHPLLLELAHLQQPRHRRLVYLLPLPVLQALQVLDLVQLHAQLVLRQERVLLDQPRHVLQPLQGQLPLGHPLVQVVTDYPVVEGRVVHPLRVQLVDRVRPNVEDLPDLPQSYPRPLVLHVVLEGVVLVELLGQQLQRPLGHHLLPLLQLLRVLPPRLQLQQLLQVLLLLLHALQVQLLLPLYLPLYQLNVEHLRLRVPQWLAYVRLSVHVYHCSATIRPLVLLCEVGEKLVLVELNRKLFIRGLVQSIPFLESAQLVLQLLYSPLPLFLLH